MKLPQHTALVVALVSVVACSASGKKGNQFDTGAGGSSSGSGTSSGMGGVNLTGSGGGSSTSSGGPACSDAAKLVYVLSDANDLYSFQPDKKIFTKIGPLQCQTTMQPNSMAVDRNATAWVNYVQNDGAGTDTAGSIFKVDTSNGGCQPTNIALPAGWYRLGMGFATDMMGGTSETLYVDGTAAMLGLSNGPGLGKVDLNAMHLSAIGQFSGALSGQSAELTGTGDARLYGFFTTTPIQVGEVDRGTGAVPKPASLPQVETPAAWAFSFWGGSFYLYTAPDPTLDPTRTTNVTKYDPQSGTADTTYMTNIGFRIVGAGVSTCAPVTPPK